jgi:electron transfer flavoprotein alpha subunit
MSEPLRHGDALPRVKHWDIPEQLLRSQVEVVHRAAGESDMVNIADADVLVAGGAGMGGPEGFEILRPLAEVLSGELAASRPAVDAGWVPYERQVGQTGKTVQPRLYVAVGISGSVQHRAGMQSAERIVAINSDRAAPIFDVADYGIVADYREVVPLLVEQFRSRKEAAR